LLALPAQERPAPDSDVRGDAVAVRPAPQRLVGGVAEYVVRKNDTLRTVGARFGIDANTLAHDNQLKPGATLIAGERLRIDNRHIVPPDLDSAELVVNVPQRMVFHRNADGSTVGYPVAVGRRDWPTPTGTFVVTELERHPTWEVPPSILEESRRAGRIQVPVVPPGPDNPLGDYWIGLSLSGIGIHATNVPSSIFRTVSHGCIRVHPDDIAQLFGRVRPGSPGRVVYQPVLMAIQGGAAYLEVHRDVYGRVAGALPDLVRRMAADAGVFERIDWATADAVLAAHDGIARDVTRLSSGKLNGR
jgi:L,D-transpeptidase ErfK/SrfK